MDVEDSFWEEWEKTLGSNENDSEHELCIPSNNDNETDICGFRQRFDNPPCTQPSIVIISNTNKKKKIPHIANKWQLSKKNQSNLLMNNNLNALNQFMYNPNANALKSSSPINPCNNNMVISTPSISNISPLAEYKHFKSKLKKEKLYGLLCVQLQSKDFIDINTYTKTSANIAFPGNPQNDF